MGLLGPVAMNRKRNTVVLLNVVKFVVMKQVLILGTSSFVQKTGFLPETLS